MHESGTDLHQKVGAKVTWNMHGNWFWNLEVYDGATGTLSADLITGMIEIGQSNK